jgi:DNA-binding LytR/AlgR family response regulator
MVAKPRRADDASPVATAIIAEDERALREDLEGRLAALWPRLKIIGSVDSGIDALTRFDRDRPDVMFLDIQMPGLTGVEVARQVAERCHIVFITAFDDHAVEAFEHGAVDYVLKPFDTPRLAQTVRRVQDRLAAPPTSLSEILNAVAAAAQPKTYMNWIKASQGSEVSLIMVRDVCYFRADAKYTMVVTADREFVIRRSIKDLLAELDPALFWQIHRSTIVAAEAIASVGRNLVGEIVLKLKARPERLAVSAAHRHHFRHM